MQQSNTYIIVFSGILTILLGGLLSITSVVLKPTQDKQVDLDTKKKILSAVTDISSILEADSILSLYDKKIESFIVDYKGNLTTTDQRGNEITAEKVNIQKNSKLPTEKRNYPVFLYKNETGKIQAYVFPMFGSGLWDWISGFVALDNSFNEILGIAFDHRQETPGLGARITDASVQNRYQGKQIFNGSELISVTMVKGEGNTGLTDYEVDGLSGATLTAKGVNNMLKKYLECYLPYIQKVKTGNKLVVN